MAFVKKYSTSHSVYSLVHKVVKASWYMEHFPQLLFVTYKLLFQIKKITEYKKEDKLLKCYIKFI